MIKVLLLAFALVAAAVSATAAAPLPAPPDGVYLYRLTHSTHGSLGTHRITIATDGDTRTVAVERKLKVTVLLVTAYRETTTTQETWRDGVMVSFSSRSDKGDGVQTLTVAAEGDRLVGQGPAGPVALPLGTFPTHPWNPAIVYQTLLMDTGDGHAVSVLFSPAGSETVKVGGQAVAAQRYEMTGDEKRTLWFDDAGRLLKQVIYRDGDTVTFALDKLPS